MIPIPRGVKPTRGPAHLATQGAVGGRGELRLHRGLWGDEVAGDVEQSTVRCFVADAAMRALVQAQLASLGLPTSPEARPEDADVLITDDGARAIEYVGANPEGLCLKLQPDAVLAAAGDVPYGKPALLTLPHIPEDAVRRACGADTEESGDTAGRGERRGAMGLDLDVRSDSHHYSLPWAVAENTAASSRAASPITGPASAQFARALDQRRYTCLREATGPRALALSSALSRFRELHGRWPLLHTDYADCGPGMRAGPLGALAERDRGEMSTILSALGSSLSVAAARRYEGARGLRRASLPPDLGEGPPAWNRVPCTARNRVAALAALEAAKHVSGTGCVAGGALPSPVEW